MVTILLLTYFLNPFRVPSWSPIDRITGFWLFRNPTASMEPTLPRGGFFVANGRPYLTRSPQPGDVVILRFPPDPSVLYVERVIAAGGTRVSLAKCRAIVNGMPLNEPYAIAEGDGANMLCTFGPVVVPKDHYFVLGDNRTTSADSRVWGFVPKANVLASVLTR
jgi:signal peptidase I